MDIEVKDKANRRHVGHNPCLFWYEAGGFSG